MHAEGTLTVVCGTEQAAAAAEVMLAEAVTDPSAPVVSYVKSGTDITVQIYLDLPDPYPTES